MLKRKRTKEEIQTPNGRKYKLALIMMLAMLAGFALAALNPVLAKIYAELLTGLGMIYLTYCGGNVGNKWVLGKKGGLSFGSDNNSPPVHEGPPPPAEGEQ